MTLDFMNWLAIGKFSEWEMEQIQNCLLVKQLKKNEVLLWEGTICQSMYFIQTGSLYEYVVDELEEKVLAIHGPGEWCLNYASFISQTTSQSFIKAHADSQVLELTIHQIHALIAISPVYLQLGKLLEGSFHRAPYLNATMTPAERYEHLLLHRSQLLQLFPLKMIASYLQMTPETLSRVRARF